MKSDTSIYVAPCPACNSSKLYVGPLSSTTRGVKCETCGIQLSRDIEDCKGVKRVDYAMVEDYMAALDKATLKMAIEAWSIRPIKKAKIKGEQVKVAIDINGFGYINAVYFTIKKHSRVWKTVACHTFNADRDKNDVLLGIEMLGRCTSAEARKELKTLKVPDEIIDTIINIAPSAWLHQSSWKV